MTAPLMTAWESGDTDDAKVMEAIGPMEILASHDECIAFEKDDATASSSRKEGREKHEHMEMINQRRWKREGAEGYGHDRRRGGSFEGRQSRGHADVCEDAEWQDRPALSS